MDGPSNTPGEGPEQSGLQADFYLLVLAAVYHADGLWGEATFDLYARGEETLVACGIEEAVDAVCALAFSQDEIAWLRAQQTFSQSAEGWFHSLEHLRFAGDIHAVPEGTLVAPGAPLLRVTAPLPVATLLQTRLLQIVANATLSATRAAEMVEAASGRRLYEFASRRMPDGRAAARVARSACVGGFYATSNGWAARQLGMPVMGTLSADFVAAYGDEHRALEAFAIHFPKVGYVNLPPGSIPDAVAALKPHAATVKVVRVDSENLADDVRRVRTFLDAADMAHVHILATGSLDREGIVALGDAPADLIGVGKALARAQVLGTGFSYRLAELWRGPDPELVRGPGASRWPGRKQVYRTPDRDVLAHEGEVAEGRPLLEPFVIAGERVREPESVATAQARCEEQRASWPNGRMLVVSERLRG